MSHLIIRSPETIAEKFLEKTLPRYSLNEKNTIQQAISFILQYGQDCLTSLNVTCFQQGINIADTLGPLDPDCAQVTAALLYPLVQYADIAIEDVQEQFSNEIANIINGVIQMNELRMLQQKSSDHSQNRRHLENIRKMLVTMVEDTRVVLIKLAERAYSLVVAETLSSQEQQEIAQETMNIYAPLANRLGVSQLKWQLEDYSFRYLQPDIYKNITASLALNNTEHEALVKNAIDHLTSVLTEHGMIQFNISGRVKHIYSIYRKMQRKKVGIEEIYDVLAIRVLTTNIEDCYTVLSHVHTLWPQIPQEFDDYVATPKSNGYQSIHTAVVGPGNKNLEVQIRTEDMNKHAEMGVAAHWHYKQGGKRPTHEGKIAWLRQVLEWEKELNQPNAAAQPDLEHHEERIYVFTPTGEIKELPKGSTPLDFAYHVHSEVGHRCRGAKVNGSIVPLTYRLKTGEQVEILTARLPHPSRDWMIPHMGYLFSARARAKVQHWFKQLDHAEHVTSGHAILVNELQRLNLGSFDLTTLLGRFNFNHLDDLYAAIGNGDLRPAQIVSMIQTRLHADEPVKLNLAKTRIDRHPEDIHIDGVGNLMTNIARCCQPIPGDKIVGYITRGRGVTIHKQECANILHASEDSQKRLIEISWGLKPKEFYPVEVIIDAHDRHGLIRDVTTLLSHERINVLSLATTTDKNANSARIMLTIEISDLSHLSNLFDKVSKISHIHTVKRV